MSPEEKIAKAKARLILRSPYFGLLAGRLKTQPADEVATFLSDGRVLRYNPDFFADASIESVEFALANSVLHHVLAHENRRRKRQGRLWRLATDYAVNAILKENGFSLPKEARFEARFTGKYAEEIYAVLKDEIRNEAYSDEESDDEGLNERKNRMKEVPSDGQKDRSYPLPSAELDPATEVMWQAAMKEAMKKAQNLGSGPVGMQRLFAKTAGASVAWRNELYHAISRHQKSDYTYLRPNKKTVSQNLYLPSATSETLTLAVAVDTSGSVDETLLGRFVAELEALLLGFPRVEVDVIVCDAKVQGVWRFVSGEALDFSLKGGGGTDFRPVFTYIDEALPQTSLLLYFTDGRGLFPKEPPLYETIWILPEEAAVPFGRVMTLDGTV